LSFYEPAHEKLLLRARAVGTSLAGREEPRALVEALAREGLLRVFAPGRLRARPLCALREGLAHASSLADTMFVMQGLGSYPIAHSGNAALVHRYVEEAAAGRRIAAFALTEPEAGSDAASLRTTARRVRGGWVLDGLKTLISNAGVADFYTVFARTGAKELSAFVVDADAPGLTVARRIELIAPHPIGDVAFRECRVPEAARLGVRGSGLETAFATLDLFRPSVGAAAVGLAQRALDEAVERVKTRRQFGSALSDFQGTRFRLAEMQVELDAARLLVQRAAWLWDLGRERPTLAAAEAKLFATEAAQRIVDSAVQLHGGLGVVRGVVVERLYREVRALRIYEGTSEIQKLIIARELLHPRTRPPRRRSPDRGSLRDATPPRATSQGHPGGVSLRPHTDNTGP